MSTELSSIKCPRCQSAMRLRNGSFGKFWGCSTYPACKGTREFIEPTAEELAKVEPEPGSNSDFMIQLLRQELNSWKRRFWEERQWWVARGSASGIASHKELQSVPCESGECPTCGQVVSTKVKENNNDERCEEERDPERSY